MAGTGIEAEVAQRTSTHKHRGFLNYLIDTLKLSVNYRTQDYRVEMDDEVREGKFLSVNVANGSMFGYNFVVAPLADVQDGNLQVVMMHNAPKWKYFMHSWRLLNRSIDKAPFVEIKPVKNVKIQSYGQSFFHLDGDGFESPTKNFEAEIVPKSLKVVVPNG